MWMDVVPSKIGGNPCGWTAFLPKYQSIHVDGQRSFRAMTSIHVDGRRSFRAMTPIHVDGQRSLQNINQSMWMDSVPRKISINPCGWTIFSKKH
jgi:hypothetical protein